ncbi:MAG: hypothetical protein AAGA32_02210 [Pseudomonadota bacterium]
MSEKGADWDTLPDDYAPERVLGVSRGDRRPTIYFDDYARFIQSHARPEMLGFHLPPLEQVLFVNMDATSIRKYRLMLDRWPANDPRRLEYARQIAGARGRREKLNGARLFEIRRSVSDPDRLIPHVSRAHFERVTLPEAQDLIGRIRRRTAVKSREGKGRSAVWCFADA